MATTAKPPAAPQPGRRLWRTPTSRAKWIVLIIALLIYAAICVWYMHALKVQQYPGPSSDPLRLFGIVSFVLVLIVAAYTLRRRFLRTLPGRVQDWLWIHTWLGIAALFIAFMHENYSYILNSYCFRPYCFTSSAGGMSALYALLLLVASGIVGRLLDVWQAHIIAREASRNGVGIAQSVEDHLAQLALTIERLGAGKSQTFKAYCQQALVRATVPPAPPALPPHEHNDLQRASDALTRRAQLARSLRRQKRASFIIKGWRSIHIPLACAALAVIGIHSSVELLKMLLQLLGR
jgi:membrane protease YdiL (CAAX protease family)